MSFATELDRVAFSRRRHCNGVGAQRTRFSASRKYTTSVKCRGRLYLDTLAAAYAEAGRLSDAVETARKALEITKQPRRDGLAEPLSAQINFYEDQKPYRDGQGGSQSNPT
jgi:hypothetical protein